MMQTTRAHRLERLAQRHAAATPVHSVWQDIGESDESVQRKIQEMKDSGRASEGDRFVVTGWGAPKKRANNRGPGSL
jgi:hypothetical protein